MRKTFKELLEEINIMDTYTDDDDNEYDDGEEDIEYFDDDGDEEVEDDDDDYNNPIVVAPKMNKQDLIDKLKRLSQIKQTTKKINNTQPAPVQADVPAQVPAQTAPVQPKNNDGRLTCYACGAPTRKAGGGAYDICSVCGK